MPPAEEAHRLARIAAVTEDLDETLDRLFAITAELKTILAREPGAPQHDEGDAP
jgi:hypothetical protein